eukprot:TRINITY_DN3037_c0_g2_i3.p4 TRINITY_DN3037_c0_g2~~TRINITY_DN3037_c0_g2_i3.p4  ORF type:complete len:150 (-),score=16.29 TRINITY_DN3037_c0_g2_i3:208-657(-)
MVRAAEEHALPGDLCQERHQRRRSVHHYHEHGAEQQAGRGASRGSAKSARLYRKREARAEDIVLLKLRTSGLDLRALECDTDLCRHGVEQPTGRNTARTAPRLSGILRRLLASVLFVHVTDGVLSIGVVLWRDDLGGWCVGLQHSDCVC